MIHPAFSLSVARDMSVKKQIDPQAGLYDNLQSHSPGDSPWTNMYLLPLENASQACVCLWGCHVVFLTFKVLLCSPHILIGLS